MTTTVVPAPIRPGFPRLLAEVSLGHVGVVFGREMSRLSRSCRDWHQLLELCALFQVLIADPDGVYDPTDPSERLLLGLRGKMSEAELHVLKSRMHQGKLNKAKRGELFTCVPRGYVRSSDGGIASDPDDQVQAVVRLIFDQFDREATMHGLLRYLVHHQVRIPVRVRGGPGKGQLEWRRPNRATLQNLLRHPSYAGAYRFGHRPTDPRKKQPERPTTGKLIRRPEECLVLLRDRLPAYITWDRFEANQARLTSNRQLPATPGAPRNGPAVLAGLVRCGRCNRRMVVRYSGPKGRPSYTCTRGSADYSEPLCQGLSNGAALDELVARQLLRRSSRPRWRRAWRRWPGWSGSGPSWPDSGVCGGSGPGTRRTGRAGSTTRSTRRTGGWPANGSGSGRRSWPSGSGWTRSTRGSGPSSRVTWRRRTAGESKRWRPTCRGCGTGRRRPAGTDGRSTGC